MTRQEKIETMQDVFWNHHNKKMRIGDQACIAILDAIEPPEIEVGMWGKFGDGEEQAVYGEVQFIDRLAIELVYETTGNNWYEHFQPIPGLKEAIHELDR